MTSASISTYLGYRIFSNNLSQSLQRVAAEPSTSSDQAYFEANISKVTSVDGLLKNYRLFTYAMKAYGLSDLGNAQALMKQVLESDLSDPNSVANRLNDSRYTAFAKAFNFTTTGSVASSSPAQTAAQSADLASRLGGAASASVLQSMASVTSVSSLESDAGLYSNLLSAYGLDAKTTSKADVTAALESNLSNPYSFANRVDTGGSTTYAKLRAMAQDFNFAADGSTGGQTQLQSAQSIASTQTAYMSTVPSDAASQAAAATESAYYAKTLPTLTSVDQITSNTRLMAYIKTAFGLPSGTTANQLGAVLTSNLLDPKSTANTLGVDSTTSTFPTPYQTVASAFSIGTDGTAWDHSAAVSSASLSSITSAYTTATLASSTASDAVKASAALASATETTYFESHIGAIKSVSGLMADTRLTAYLRKAFALPAPVAASGTTPAVAGTSDTQLAAILQSDITDPKSAANTSGTSARNLALAFNFAPDGYVYSQRPIQSAANVTATTTAYTAQAGTSTAATAAAATETAYYTATMPRMKSVDDILSDKRLVSYLTAAYNLPATNTTTLRQVLTSNLFDTKSKANTLGGGYQTLAAAFDISSTGGVTHTADRQVQTKSGIAATHAAYLEQVMESEASDQYGVGVQLALYFKRVAPTITNAYGILADKALTKVVQTTLGLPATASAADIDSQARTITSKIKIADFKDPVKLDKLLARFSALYDLTNSSSSSSSNITALFG